MNAKNNTTKICSIDGCESKTLTRGWCRKHWARWQRHGDPLTNLKPLDLGMTVRERLEKNSELVESGCREWTKYTTAGYGQLSVNGKLQTTHRLAYEEYVGKIPEDMCVLHRCDNPPCINPDHLFLGTHQDNMDDMNSKGRGNQAKGVDHGSVKLTESQVLEIRQMRGSQESIATIYGVSSVTIGHIKRRKTWGHI